MIQAGPLRMLPPWFFPDGAYQHLDSVVIGGWVFRRFWPCLCRSVQEIDNEGSFAVRKRQWLVMCSTLRQLQLLTL